MYFVGQVYLIKPLDRDQPNGRARWDINVLASDEPGTAMNRIGYAILSVFPTDINDNYPLFDEKTLTKTYQENGNIGKSRDRELYRRTRNVYQ